MSWPACAVCGTAAPADPPPIDWSSSLERGRTTWTCPACTREHLRSIEAKLDADRW